MTCAAESTEKSVELPGRARMRLALGLAAVFLAGLLLRLHAIEVYSGPLAGDALGYHRLALNLVEGNGYSRDVGPLYRPEYERPFVYPAFVAAIYRVAGPRPMAVAVVQAVLGAGLALIVWVLGRRLYPSYPGAAWLAATATALNPMLISLSPQIMRETLHSLLLGVLALCLLKACRERGMRALALTGALFGLVTLSRSEYVAALPVVAAYVGYLSYSRGTRRRAVAAQVAAFLLPALALAALWPAYVHDRFGRISLGPQSGVVLVSHAATVYEPRDSTAAFGVMLAECGIGDRELRAMVERDAQLFYRMLPVMERRHGSDLMQIADTLGRASLEILWRHPVRWLAVSGFAVVNSSLGYSDLAVFVGQENQRRYEAAGFGGLWRQGHWGLAAAYAFGRVVMGAVVLAAFAVAVFAFAVRRDCELAVPLLLIAVVFVTSLMGGYLARVRAPMDALMVCYGSGALLMMAGKARYGVRRRLAMRRGRGA